MSREFFVELLHRRGIKPLFFILFILLDIGIVYGVLKLYHRSQTRVEKIPVYADELRAFREKNFIYICPDCGESTRRVGQSYHQTWFSNGVQTVTALGLDATLEWDNFCDACRAPEIPEPWFYVTIRRGEKTTRARLDFYDFDILAAHLRNSSIVIIDHEAHSMRLFEPRVRELLGDNIDSNRPESISVDPPR